MPLLTLELRPSPLYALLLLAVALCALPATLAAHHEPWLKWTLLAVVLASLARCAWQEWRAGMRRIELTTDGDVVLADAAGRTRRGPYAGHALLGSLAVFVFIGRSGWRRWLGPQRIAVLRDATAADDFRRLRARVRLGISVAG